MKVLFTGLPYFTSKFVKELKDFDMKNSFVFCDTYTSRKDKIRFFYHLFTTDVVVSFNGVTSKSKALDLALRFKKKLILQWHGTDVLMVTKNKENNLFTDKYLTNSKSFTDAVWLQKELKKQEIDADILAFKSLKVTKNNTPFQTKNVLTYIAKGREKFYGINAIIALAHSFPETHFDIMGTDGEGQEKLKNISYLGWIPQKKAKEIRSNSAIFIRLTEHDGFSLSVMEALANGNYVIWNNPHPKCVFFDKKEDLNLKFAKLLEDIDAKKLQKSQENIAWCKENLDKDVILKKYIQTLKSIAEK